MERTQSRIKYSLIAVTVFLATLASPVHAAGKGKSDNSQKVKPSPMQTAVAQAASAWINPSAKSDTPIVVQAGRTLPMRFKLVLNGTFLNSSDLVKVSLTALSGCSATSAAASAPIVLVTPVPTPATSLSPSPSSSTPVKAESGNDVLRVENSVFQFNWKVPKSQAAGCYLLSAEKSTAKISSPVIKVRSSK